ncbi:MAG: DUF1467 family protein [Pseudomonadota bacterium]
MGITSAIVLYAVIWFLTLLCVIPVRLETQGDRGEIVPGTHAGSPVNPQMKKRFLITTGIAAVIWVIVAGIIFSGVISIRDIDVFDRMAVD